MDFVPFDATPAEIEARSVLRAGVPVTMKPDLVNWLVLRLGGGSGISPSVLRRMQNVLDIVLIGAQAEAVSQGSARRIFGGLSDRDLMRVVDLALYEVTSAVIGPGSDLENILRDGRSKWSVVLREGRERIGERLPAGVQVAAEALIGSGSVPGRILGQAWGDAFDVEPRDSSAYASAVKAVEAAALSALGIDKPLATLGDAIRAVERDENSWRLPFLREHTQYPSRDVLLGMMKSLYRGQRDRHGSEAYSDVTHDEAQAAVFAAVALVGWLSCGLVRQRDVDQYG